MMVMLFVSVLLFCTALGSQCCHVFGDVRLCMNSSLLHDARTLNELDTPVTGVIWGGAPQWRVASGAGRPSDG